MTAIELRKGQNRPLITAAGDQCHRIQVILTWADPASRVDVDVSALLLGADGKVRSDDDLVFYNSPVGADGAVRLAGKSVSEDGSEDRVSIDVEALPDTVQQVAIAGSLDAESGVGFGVLDALSVAIVDAQGDVLFSYIVDDASSETAFVFGELYLRADQWKFRAVGQGWDSGLAGLAGDYGITVVDDAELDGVDGVNGEPDAGDGPADLAVESSDPDTMAGQDRADPPPTDSHDPAQSGNPELTGSASPDSATNPTVVSQHVDDVDLAPVELEPGPGVASDVMPDDAPAVVGSDAPPKAAVKPAVRGVQTRKVRPKPAPLPPMTLSGGPQWSSARLFSIYGVGALDEQEKRATSAVLTTMMAVREFGRAVVSRLGGPSGTIETYQEVQFKLGERTVVPDGVIRVGRGGKVWTALLETKTGTNPLRADQIEAYIEVAQARGFDAVVTLSNEIALVGGDHPAAVDRKRLKKTALQHVAWSEILHEARMQSTHRGVEDRLQAWVLSEFIRYLEHPRSGAAGFEDMGSSWVPVREAIRSGSLRTSNAKVIEVVRSWDRLTRHLSMRLSSQLGVGTTVVVSRQLAADANARMAASVNRLVADGTLQAQLRIQQSVGVLEVIADLRSNRVRVTVDVDAPKEGGASRRVNWLLRQLKTAPDDLSIEVIVARSNTTACELLKDVRENAAALFPDPSVEVKSFRLFETFPLGQKRNGLKSAFIPSVNAAVESFYAQVVQGLKPWTKPAAKLPAEVAEEAAETIESLDQDATAALSEAAFTRAESV